MSKMVYQTPEQRAADPNFLHLKVVVRQGVVDPGGVVRLPAHKAEERKLHAWSVVAMVRDDQNRIAGVKVACDRCGDEVIVNMPGGLCQG